MHLHREIIAISATLLIAILNTAPTEAQTNCGSLNEEWLYRENDQIKPSEYPWTGLSLHIDEDGEKRYSTCGVVVVGDRHVITTASCYYGFHRNYTRISVLLGLWEQKPNPENRKYLCDDKGFCVPAPIEYMVDDIKVHPDFDRDTEDYNVVLMRLKESIQRSDTLEPICLRPRVNRSLTDRNFHYTGYNEENSIKGKGDVVVLSRPFCNSIASPPPPKNQFCGLSSKALKYYEGSPIMGMNLENDVPDNFYLIGILTNLIDKSSTFLMYLFQDLRPLMGWIEQNMIIT